MSTVFRFCIFVIFTSALAGCAAVDSVNAYLEKAEREAGEALLAQSSSACKKYGFTVGTDAFASCVQTEVNNIKNRDAIAASAAAAASRRSDSSSSSAQEVHFPRTTTCMKTLLGLECTTR